MKNKKKKTPLQRIEQTKKRLEEMIKNRERCVYYMAIEFHFGDLPREDFGDGMDETIADLQIYEELLNKLAGDTSHE